MTNNPTQPREYDAVLGFQVATPVDAVVLGGIAGVKRRLESKFTEVRIAALFEALKYGEAGLELVSQALFDPAKEVEETAYQILLKSEEPKAAQALWDFNYFGLQNLLEAELWREADDRTSAIMLEIGDRKKEGFLRVEDIENFPCEHLQIIDKLWLKYSNGKFAFSVQKSIWDSVGGNPEPNWDIWCSFGEQNGWFANNSWLWWNDLTFTLDAPAGHLPRGGAFMGWGLGDFWTGCRVFSSLSLRLTKCQKNHR